MSVRWRLFWCHSDHNEMRFPTIPRYTKSATPDITTARETFFGKIALLQTQFLGHNSVLRGANFFGTRVPSANVCKPPEFQENQKFNMLSNSQKFAHDRHAILPFLSCFQSKRHPMSSCFHDFLRFYSSRWIEWYNATSGFNFHLLATIFQVYAFLYGFHTWKGDTGE